MDNNESLAHTKWDCTYHIVWIRKYRRNASDSNATQQEEDALRSALNLQQEKREEAPWQMWCIAYW